MFKIGDTVRLLEGTGSATMIGSAKVPKVS